MTAWGFESATAFSELGRPVVYGDPNPFDVPVMLVAATEDWFFPPEYLKSTAESYGIKAVIFKGGHNLMAEKCWKEVAMSIDNWLNSNGV